MPTVTLSGCAILKQEKILLIRKKDRDFWELPGGTANPQDLEQAAADKTREQIGVEPTIIQQFTVLEYQKDDRNVEATIFECDIDHDTDLAAGDNIDEVKWFSTSELKNEKIGADVEQVLEEIQS